MQNAPMGMTLGGGLLTGAGLLPPPELPPEEPPEESWLCEVVPPEPPPVTGGVVAVGVGVELGTGMSEKLATTVESAVGVKVQEVAVPEQ